jgi:hypothetical protein
MHEVEVYAREQSPSTVHLDVSSKKVRPTELGSDGRKHPTESKKVTFAGVSFVNTKTTAVELV